MRVRIATRGSKLALIQAQLVADALKRALPEHEFVLETVTTHGDRHQQLRLSESPREGVFVKELELALLEGRAELAVHSAKDLPTLETPGLVIAAFPARADARDVLISRSSAQLTALPKGARVGTGSPRRAAQLKAVRPDLQTCEIRGNVDTRLRRLQEGAVDALVLAAAGLERLGRLTEANGVLPFELMLPAPGQGALAVQAVPGSQAAKIAAAIDDAETRRAVTAERALLRRLGGGCLSAVGAHAAVSKGELQLDAVVLSATGERVLRATAEGADDEAIVDQVARSLEDQGASSLLNPRGGVLAGLRVMVTRPDGQAHGLADRLRVEGAEVVICPVIEIEPLPVGPDRLANLGEYGWLILTSANGVDRLFGLLGEANLRFPTHIKVAAIGPETASRIRSYGVDPAVVPERYVAEDLADQLSPLIRPKTRVLLARAAGARDVLPERLEAAGARVEVLETYRAVAPAGLSAKLAESASSVDVVTFTSSSTVQNFVEAGGAKNLESTVVVACIGPITAQTAQELGLKVDIIASEYTARGLVDALVRYRAPVSA